MPLFNKRKGAQKAPPPPPTQAEPKPSDAASGSSTPPMTPPASVLQNVPIPSAPDPNLDPAGYLRSIHAVRERSRIVSDEAMKNKLNHFDVDLEKYAEVVDYVVALIKRDYGPKYANIPPHGRWQHFEAGNVARIEKMMRSWPPSIDTQERARRLIDLFVVSVLLDAGAGNRWQYRSSGDGDGQLYRRSEGLAIASLDMFKNGLFSGVEDQNFRVDSTGLLDLNSQIVSDGLQVSEKNPIDGLEGRKDLLLGLGEALKNKKFFGEDGRPGNMLDYLLAHESTQHSGPAATPIIPLPTLWNVLTDGLEPVWPASRTQVAGVSVGDAWPCTTMPKPDDPRDGWQNIVPFHKLTQWLCYSLMVPMQKLLGVHFVGVDLMTGLAEYRNGGLLLDTGLLSLKEVDARRGLENFSKQSRQGGQKNMEVVPAFETSDDVIVEWRAVTVGILDKVLADVNKELKLEGPKKLTLAQMLEAGSWKAGREIAEVSRPNTRGPPIMIISDGTVF